MDLRIGKGFNQVEATLIGAHAFHSCSSLDQTYSAVDSSQVLRNERILGDVTASWGPQTLSEGYGSQHETSGPSEQSLFVGKCLQISSTKLTYGTWPIYR